MPDSKQSPELTSKYVKDQIKFVLEVTAKTSDSVGVTDDSPINIKLNLNPDNELVYIKQSLSTKDDLLMIFERLKELITRLDARADRYAKAISYNTKGFSAEAKKGDYNQNFKPSFEKIDRIINIHESPDRSSVSYTSSYNGDLPPGKKGK